ncbi:SIR2 family NAD-dependent protein deacylase [Rugosimonospora africana]|uniref:NAD-dependent protein deacylase n=1 Tax=Rugosimonospora africana TaxID=556532 RepID=A0A8J3VR57_9ACTN|nr:NAD-dependent protein deacylase [Rugosimonospora africana]GIH15820.1 NAD-dependent protein deacylase 1 [Rugosimonospora africana]
MDAAPPSRAAQVLRDARRAVILTGAGVSAESGVPTFRDDLTGLWAQFDAERLATPEAFHADPDLVWGWYEWRRARVRAAEPNPGHRAIAAIQDRIPDSVVITQNVDDLHERAGTRSAIHLHGSLFAPRCVSEARHPATFPDARDGEVAGPDEGRRIPPPRCATCGWLVRPGVVWFGEALPEAALAAAVEAAAACDVLLAVGTSGVVYPAAAIPAIAGESGATVIQVNPEPTPLDRVCDINLRGTAGQILPTLVTAGWGADQQPAGSRGRQGGAQPSGVRPLVSERKLWPSSSPRPK